MNPEFPINGEVVDTNQDINVMTCSILYQYYRNTMSWYEYCLYQDLIYPSNVAIESHQSSF